LADGERHAENPKLVGGRLCLDFANTVDWRTREQPEEWITSYADLVAWSQHAGIVTEPEAHHLRDLAAHRPADGSAVLAQAITLREAIYRIFATLADGRPPEGADVTVLNEALAKALSRLRILPTADGFAWRWAIGEDALDRMLWPVARSAAELLTEGELTRVRTCPGEGCGWLFYDSSKNRSRRWCSMDDCGNRAKARRHYRRQRASQESTQ
jgi:predicted RNA-binding Zn ribbon-like protein